LSEPVKKADYDPEDVETIKLAEEQKKAADLATQTESIYTRNKDVWKATNRQTLEDHLVKEGIEFSKQAVDAAHAKYVGEIQASDEAKAKADAERKAAETSSSTSSKPLDEETQRMLDLTPRLAEVITDMWNASAMRRGWDFVTTTIDTKYGVHLVALSRKVYIAYNKSKGSDEGLKDLIQQHAPRPTGPQNPQSTPPEPRPEPQITPEDQKSSTNQALTPNTAAGRGSDTVSDATKSPPSGVPDEVLNVFSAARMLTDEQVISSLV
jgi:hypothetical protein